MPSWYHHAWWKGSQHGPCLDGYNPGKNIFLINILSLVRYFPMIYCGWTILVGSILCWFLSQFPWLVFLLLLLEPYLFCWSTSLFVNSPISCRLNSEPFDGSDCNLIFFCQKLLTFVSYLDSEIVKKSMFRPIVDSSKSIHFWGVQQPKIAPVAAW
jgi:hypothetical protein